MIIKKKNKQSLGRTNELTIQNKKLRLENKNLQKKLFEKQKGAKVNGRNTADHLPTFTETFDFLSEKEKTCSCCGKPFADFFTTEDSEEMVVDIKAHRRIIKKISTNVQVST